ncbi:hypothetical protein AVEN_95554-1, partial [Araneus ventricosus]
ARWIGRHLCWYPLYQTSAPHRQEDVWPSTYDLTCNRPTYTADLCGIGSRTLNPPAPKPRSYRYVTGGQESLYRFDTFARRGLNFSRLSRCLYKFSCSQAGR